MESSKTVNEHFVTTLLLPKEGLWSRPACWGQREPSPKGAERLRRVSGTRRLEEKEPAY